MKAIAALRTREPLLLEHRLGSGRIITCLTSCGTGWTNFPQYRSFVPFHFELQKYISRADRVLPSRESGAAIHLELDPAVFGPSIRIDPPKNSGQVIAELQVQPGPVRGKSGGTATPPANGKDEPEVPLRRVVDYDRTDAPGIYRVKLVDAADVNVERWYAYNTGSDEGRLELTGSAAIRQALGPALSEEVRIQEAGSTEWLAGRESDRDVREWILVLLVLVLLAEQLMAYRLTYHSRSRGAPAQGARA